MFVSYAPGYFVDIGDAHVFPMRKFPLVYERLIGDRVLAPEDVVVPTPARDEDILLAHTRDYWTRLVTGRLTPRELRRLGLPWSEALVLRSRLATQGTLNAARHALADGVAGNLAGGTHHAFPDHGEGFCVLNDIAVAVRVLQRDGDVGRVALIDCDVHQGNANAVIFAGESDVFTFSMHGKNNYPLRKPPSSLDLELPDGMTDGPYLDLLREYVPRVLKEFRPDLVFYLAGVDPYVHDRFGRLALSLEGLMRRDEFVLRACRQAGIPVTITLSGGYARDREDTVMAHCNTYRAAREVFG
ncbi:MAG: histone deacetylase [Chloracidobacterium sp.]|nr:histone deacetylase [Chloracidobacterium sp.]MDW8216752.1 histone deacetylase [Acidobacteriota bacterium]